MYDPIEAPRAPTTLPAENPARSKPDTTSGYVARRNSTATLPLIKCKKSEKKTHIAGRSTPPCRWPIIPLPLCPRIPATVNRIQPADALQRNPPATFTALCIKKRGKTVPKNTYNQWIPLLNGAGLESRQQ